MSYLSFVSAIKQDKQSYLQSLNCHVMLPCLPVQHRTLQHWTSLTEPLFSCGAKKGLLQVKHILLQTQFTHWNLLVLKPLQGIQMSYLSFVSAVKQDKRSYLQSLNCHVMLPCLPVQDRTLFLMSNPGDSKSDLAVFCPWVFSHFKAMSFCEVRIFTVYAWNECSFNR